MEQQQQPPHPPPSSQSTSDSSRVANTSILPSPLEQMTSLPPATHQSSDLDNLYIIQQQQQPSQQQQQENVMQCKQEFCRLANQIDTVRQRYKDASNNSKKKMDQSKETIKTFMQEKNLDIIPVRCTDDGTVVSTSPLKSGMGDNSNNDDNTALQQNTIIQYLRLISTQKYKSVSSQTLKRAFSQFSPDALQDFLSTKLLRDIRSKAVSDDDTTSNTNSTQSKTEIVPLDKIDLTTMTEQETRQVAELTTCYPFDRLIVEFLEEKIRQQVEYQQHMLRVQASPGKIKPKTETESSATGNTKPNSKCVSFVDGIDGALKDNITTFIKCKTVEDRHKGALKQELDPIRKDMEQLKPALKRHINHQNPAGSTIQFQYEHGNGVEPKYISHKWGIRKKNISLAMFVKNLQTITSLYTQYQNNKTGDGDDGGGDVGDVDKPDTNEKSENLHFSKENFQRLFPSETFIKNFAIILMDQLERYAYQEGNTYDDVTVGENSKRRTKVKKEFLNLPTESASPRIVNDNYDIVPNEAQIHQLPLDLYDTHNNDILTSQFSEQDFSQLIMTDFTFDEVENTADNSIYKQEAQQDEEDLDDYYDDDDDDNDNSMDDDNNSLSYRDFLVHCSYTQEKKSREKELRRLEQKRKRATSKGKRSTASKGGKRKPAVKKPRV